MFCIFFIQFSFAGPNTEHRWRCSNTPLHTYTHFQKNSPHTPKATGCHSNLSEMVTPTTAPAITLFTNNHAEPTSSRIRDLAKTNNVGKQKKKIEKKICMQCGCSRPTKMNFTLQQLCCLQLHHTIFV